MAATTDEVISEIASIARASKSGRALHTLAFLPFDAVRGAILQNQYTLQATRDLIASFPPPIALSNVGVVAIEPEPQNNLT